MKYQLTPASPVPAEPKKYPYFAYDNQGFLCLVGRHCAIMLEQQNGNGYTSPGFERAVFEDVSRLISGTKVTLIQD